MEDTQLTSLVATVNESHDQILKLTVTVNSLIARLEAFEKMHTSNSIAPKRTIKTTQDTDDVASVSSTGSKLKSTKVVAVVDNEPKIANALAFFKKIVMFKNYNELRSKYTTADMINTAKVNVKQPEGTEAYWISVGNVCWKVLDKDQKKDVRDEYIKWKNVHQTIEDSSQLNEDDTDLS